MSYAVYVQKFRNGEPFPADFGEVISVLSRYGSVTSSDERIQFVPNGDDICEVGFIGGSQEEGIASIGFERPVSGGRLAQLVFELLGITGMCYFEQDCTYVLARSDVAADLPEGLTKMCELGRVTVISAVTEVPL